MKAVITSAEALEIERKAATEEAPASSNSRRKGFFTDTTLCIGCKACEVACKQWNQLPEDGLTFTGMSYDNTVSLGASTWRHVAFIERPVALSTRMQGPFRGCSLPMSASTARARGVWNHARRAQSSGRNSIRCMYSRMSAMAADIA